MKKLILLFIGIILSTVLGATVSTLAFSSEEEVLDNLFDKVGIGRTYKNDYKEIESLSQSELPFENLYLFMLQNVIEGPKEAAIDELKKRERYTENQLESILFDGDIKDITKHYDEIELEDLKAEYADRVEHYTYEIGTTYEEAVAAIASGESATAYVLWSKANFAELYPLEFEIENYEKSATQEYALDEYTRLRDLYLAEVELQTENRKLAFETLAGEMFMNNDLSDSANIDLLYDLDSINYLLFNSNITYPDRSGSDEVELASFNEAKATLDELMAVEEPKVMLASESDEPLGDLVNPYACLDDEDLRAALEDFGYTEEDIANIVVADPNAADNNGSNDTEEEGTGSGYDASTNDYTEKEEEFESLKDALAYTEGDWSRGLPCNEVFCITIDIITGEYELKQADYAPEEEIEETDNCIACHTAYINERLQDTMSKSLVPSKIPMNWFEDATCKEAGKNINLDFNVFTIKKPIELDPGDDLADKAEKDIDNFKNTLVHLGALPDLTRDKPGKSEADIACESINQLRVSSGSSETLEEAILKCVNATDLISEKAATENDAFIFEVQADQNSTLFEQMSGELFNVLQYFTEFKTALEETHQSELKSLLSKEYCT